MGRLVVQTFLEVPRLQRAVGVELEASRHDSAIQAWNSIEQQAHALRASRGDQSSVFCDDAIVQFIQGDLFQVDLSDVTHVYVASLCFPTEMMERLAYKLLTEASRLQVVATLQPFPTRFQGGKASQRVCGNVVDKMERRRMCRILLH